MYPNDYFKFVNLLKVQGLIQPIKVLEIVSLANRFGSMAFVQNKQRQVLMLITHRLYALINNYHQHQSH
jgi:hypothetical protein